MHYNIRYTGTKHEKRAQALKDVLDWFPRNGIASELASRLRETHARNGWRRAYSQGRFYLAFSGVQGFPVLAFVRAALRGEV